MTEYDINDNPNGDDDADADNDVAKKKVVSTKTMKPTTIRATPADAFRGDIDFVLADLGEDREEEKVPFPEFGVDIVFRKGYLKKIGSVPFGRKSFARPSIDQP